MVPATVFPRASNARLHHACQEQTFIDHQAGGQARTTMEIRFFLLSMVS